MRTLSGRCTKIIFNYLYNHTEGKVCEVHGTGGLDGEPHAPQDLSSVHDPQELVLRGGLVEQSDLLVDEERVRHPDELDVLRAHHQLLQVRLFIKGQAGVHPELPEVHVEGEVHELLRELSDGEDVEGDAHRDGDAAIVGPDSPVVANLK